MSDHENPNEMYDTPYQKALNYLYTSLPTYQRQGEKAIKKMGLEKITQLCKKLGNPEKNFKSIHIAGTNGKGSTSHALAAVLQAAGYKTGLYTSPHLKDFRERIRLNGKVVTKSYVVDFIQKYKNLFEQVQPSFFEMSVAMAFHFFAQEKIDIAVIEVGLGGRLDATNVIMPEVALITNISLDHTTILGTKLSDIAYEKAGIIKMGVPAVIGQYHLETAPVFEKIAKTRHAQLIQASEKYHVAMLHQAHDHLIVDVKKDDQIVFKNLVIDGGGLYQMHNIPAILSILDVLCKKGFNIDKPTIRKGLKTFKKLTGLLARWQVLSKKPLVICDAAHNQTGVQQVVQQLNTLSYTTLHIILGISKKPEKEALAILGLLPREAIYYFVQAQTPRAMPAEQLATLARKLNLQGAAYKNVQQGISQAKKNTSDDQHALTLIIGSIYMIGETYKCLEVQLFNHSSYSIQ